jgi:hypothetical protein
MELSELEQSELATLEALGGARTDEQSTRYWALMQRKSPPPSAEWTQAFHEKHPQIRQGFAAINRGDLDEARRLLQALAPPPRELTRTLERRINTALRRAARTRPPAAPHAVRAVQRPREQRAVSRPRARAPDDDRPRRRAPLDEEERRGLRRLIHRARFAWIEASKECTSCGLELPREAFRPNRRTCTDCEISARVERRHASAVAA